ncbi:UNVERIFIED_ORG: aryl-alcohol dehydrogenase-like predicted oxidoreductase [Kosakonia oryzae]|uniref:Predicted oxidoreductase n=1 Tax=Kosakonia radicincitans TaxID=283686 RepID=A0AAX2EQH8_9ENTR|nr:aldo/keto reductase family oxidoreductase [Kosakonia radicincitans]MDP9565980.1 aryl-alcohol dehydrogenase-like predicted oxidoreductase [Kosakonia oryzae]SFE19010.1 Predicted oxidoreductase [Kosakonia radicincitans]SFR07708.1 Predicted oxidoreductase [Kosakonia radicincitans]SFT69001.1 Predicted oxidoreductase [Kosakonia radicincitans]SFX46870.1 Predicted oxidoreductase [Kosakonia radicincitans]
MSQSTLTYRLGDRQVGRLGYGAMQLAGPGVFGPPADEAKALAVLRDAIAAGVNHIDTSDFYGPHVTNKLIKQALHPYPDDLCIVTKVGARRDDKANWLPAFSAEELTRAVEDNLRHLGLETIEVVNLRSMFGVHEPEEGPLEAPLEALIKLKERGLIRHIGLSNVTAKQVADAQKMTPIVCVQNLYNVAIRKDDALVDSLNAQGIAFVPFFPLGGFTPLQSGELNEVAQSLNVTPMQVALAWLLQRSPNILLIPGTSSPQHLQENMASANLVLPPEALEKLNGIGA